MLPGAKFADSSDLLLISLVGAWLAIALLAAGALHSQVKPLPDQLAMAWPQRKHFAVSSFAATSIIAASLVLVFGDRLDAPTGTSMVFLVTDRLTCIVWLGLCNMLVNRAPKVILIASLCLGLAAQSSRLGLMFANRRISGPLLVLDCAAAAAEFISFLNYLGWEWVSLGAVHRLFRVFRKDGAYSTIPTVTDTIELDSDLCTSEIHGETAATWVTSSEPETKSRPLINMLRRRWGTRLAALMVLKVVIDGLSLLPAVLLRTLLDSLNQEDNRTGQLIVVILALVVVIVAFLRTHYDLELRRISLYARSQLSMIVYKHALGSRGNEASHGDVVNYLMVDANRISDQIPSMNDLWALPLQCAFTLYLLYIQVEFAFFTGLAITVVLVPVNMTLAKKIGKVNQEMLAHNDERVLTISEIINGIKFVKMCGWSSLVLDWVREPRQKYLKCLRWVKYLDAMCVFFWATTPVFVSVATFITYSWTGHTLTAGRAIAALALFGNLIMPLNAYPWVINGVVEAWVSMNRVDAFIESWSPKHSLPRAPEGPSSADGEESAAEERRPVVRRSGRAPPPRRVARSSVTPAESDADEELQDSSAALRGAQLGPVVMVKGANIQREPASESEGATAFTLTVHEFSASAGSLVGIAGRAGSGKSTLLDAIVGELRVKSASVFANTEAMGSTVYCQQNPFLLNDTVRRNVTFGGQGEYSAIAYDAALRAVGLDVDVDSMPMGDNTLVGERGCNLSGGQRMRVNLARAMYSERKLVLVDDPVGCLDALVTTTVIERCLRAMAAAGRCVVVATHSPELLSRCDRVYSVSDASALERVGDISRFVSQMSPNQASSTAPAPATLSPIVAPQSAKPRENPEDGDDDFIDLPASETVNGDGGDEDDIVSIPSLEGEDGVAAEITETGAIPWSSLVMYTKAVGFGLGASVVLLIALMQAAKNYSDWYVSQWAGRKDADSDEFVRNLAYIAVANAILALLRSFGFAKAGLDACIVLHDKILARLLRSPFDFFTSTPPGRVINRLSKDVLVVDDNLPFNLNILLAQSFLLLGAIVVIGMSAGYIALVGSVPIFIVYFLLQRPYRRISRELKRLESAARSPLIDHLRTFLEGGPLLRSLGGSCCENFISHAFRDLDLANRSSLNLFLAQGWFGLRLQFIGCCATALVGGAALHWHGNNNTTRGAVGLALAYVGPLTSYMAGLLSAFTESEKLMVSVERVEEYTLLPTEDLTDPTTNLLLEDEGSELTAMSLPPSWPSRGEVTFDRVTVTYEGCLDPAVDQLTLSIAAGEKVAVVGRTGAGKSSVMNCLLRLVNPRHGVVRVDGVDVHDRSIDPDDVRQRFSVVPQEPFVCHGTVARNLDPFDEHSAEALTAVLHRMGLAATLPVDMVVEESGKNLSEGQRQLLSIARVVLKPTRLVLLDEPAASIDSAAESTMYGVLGGPEFATSTIIGITHNLAHLDFYDKVIVMEAGRVVDSGTPEEVQKRKLGVFAARE